MCERDQTDRWKKLMGEGRIVTGGGEGVDSMRKEHSLSP